LEDFGSGVSVTYPMLRFGDIGLEGMHTTGYDGAGLWKPLLRTSRRPFSAEAVFLTHHANNEESMPGYMDNWGSDMVSARRKANECDRHGKQGILNTASKQQLENEFGTSKEDDVVKKILTEGSVQSSEVRTPSPSTYISYRIPP
jgi:hypothetical protein